MRRIVVIALAGAVVSGCGSGERAGAPPPRLPAQVASLLAQESRSVADSLGRGDACMARLHLSELSASARGAIVSGAVPRPFRRHLVAAVNRLGVRMPPCVVAPPPPPPVPQSGEDEGGPGKGHGKAKGHGKDKGKGHKG